MVMAHGWRAVFLVLLACGGAGAGERPSKPEVGGAAVAEGRSVAERTAEIRAEFDAAEARRNEAFAKVTSDVEIDKIIAAMPIDEVAFSRRMVDEAETSPKEPAARDALLWVLDKLYMADGGPYGSQVNRAVQLLVQWHADDTNVAIMAYRMVNGPSRHRDAFLDGIYAGAKSREAKGIATLAYAQYLEMKSGSVALAKQTKNRPPLKYSAFDDAGKTIEKIEEISVEDRGYWFHLQQCDADAMHRLAEELCETAIAEYGDIVIVTPGQRRFEAILAQETPSIGGKVLTPVELAEIRAFAAKRPTVGELATARLDASRNLAVGKLAPEIEGLTLDGKPMKLSDYRGKVVALVFWATWCGPCMAEVPHEREMVERLKGKPFALLGVNSDPEPEAAVKAVQSERINWPNWQDGTFLTGEIVKRYHVRGFPTIYLLDAQGIIRKAEAGESLDQAVDRLIAEIAVTEPSKE
jgi:thiol-disulfide isomerase/thioredoxin